ncbi:TetR/AcrR family transcriptional regulator [Methanobrevibacter sp. OttesenSCG-928-K11]|nr:TetR/AcrR family transcriptional regulator [Methanobrevibacter sp. OttesenSCG-928-K11]MDL2271184.1 TetR/AcrR family transcriptional regulator [Methanobrevibacter sp. OttesenSCG-928-I08]
MKKNSTKDKIFKVSLELFSKKGYNEVSVREIAREVGIKESSIYNHYSKKEAILDDIFNYFIKNMYKAETSKKNMNSLLMKGPDKLYNFGSEMVKYQFSKPDMVKILRLIFIEMYRNDKIKEFFQKELIEKPIEFWTCFYKDLMNQKIIKKSDPEKLAKYYYEYGMFKMFEVIVIKYPLKINYEEVFNDIEGHFNFILESQRV